MNRSRWNLLLRRPNPGREASRSEKLPGALFSLVLGLGFVAALVTVFLRIHESDARPGMSLRDIEVHFHGDPNKTLLGTMIQGKMRKNLKSEKQLQTILEWIKNGAARESYGPVQVIIEDRCLRCHNPFGKASFRPFTNYERVKDLTRPDEGMSFERLALLTHQHLFGMGLLVLALSLVLLGTAWTRNITTVLILAGFSGVLLDVGGWWLTKLHGGLAPVVLIGGVMTGLFFALGIGAVWWDFLFWSKKIPPDSRDGEGEEA